MARSKESFGKKEVRNKQAKKRKEKAERRLQKKEQKASGKGDDDMFAYVDEFGVISSTPPVPRTEEELALEQKKYERNTNFLVAGNSGSGTITKLFMQKGFGFITDKDTNESLYMHLNDCIDKVNVGDQVSYIIEKGVKGFKAQEIKLDTSKTNPKQKENPTE